MILSHRLLRGEYCLMFASELANQQVQKALFTCVMYPKTPYYP